MDYSTMRRKYDHKPKKTKYGDRLYDCIIEARWAIFFDCLGINHVPVERQETVETGMKEYTHKPDFYLPNLLRYIEIKPTSPIDVEISKAAAWANYIGSEIILFNLSIPTEKTGNGWLICSEDTNQPPKVMEDYNWCECPKCGAINITEFGWPTKCGCYASEELHRMYADECEGIEIVPDFHKSLRLAEAYRVAKSYKFGKGESKKVSILPKQKTIFSVV